MTLSFILVQFRNDVLRVKMQATPDSGPFAVDLLSLPPPLDHPVPVTWGSLVECVRSNVLNFARAKAGCDLHSIIISATALTFGIAVLYPNGVLTRPVLPRKAKRWDLEETAPGLTPTQSKLQVSPSSGASDNLPEVF